MPPRFVLPLGEEISPHVWQGRSRLGHAFDDGWDGVEIGGLRLRADLSLAFKAALERGWFIGVHHPLHAGGARYASPPFVSADPALRAAALECARQSIDEAGELGAAYIVFHFPKPAKTWPGMNPDVWPIAAGDVPPEPVEPDPKRAVAVYRQALRDLEALAHAGGLRVVLELDGPNPWLYETGVLPELFAERRGLSLCLDIETLARLKTTHGLRVEAAVREWAPYVGHLHVSNTNPRAGRTRVPAHPDQRPGDGWVDVGAIVAEVLRHRPDCAIVLEDDRRETPPGRLAEARAWLAWLGR